MEIKLSEYNSNKIIHSNVYDYNFDTKKDLGESEKDITGDSYRISLKEKWFDGVHITAAEISTQNEESFYFESSHNHIGFLFCLDGNINYYCSKKIDHLFSINKNQQHVSFGKLNQLVFSIRGRVSYIYIQLTEAYMNKITNQEFKKEIIFDKTTIAPEVDLLLKSLKHIKYNGIVKRIFLESKIFELIIFYMQCNGSKCLSLKEEDVTKIQLAKQLVESNLQKPSSLMELSRKAGINDYKLKKGFKELTGYTVFGYLYRLRMEKAHYFLAQEKKTVNEVAFLIGYKNAQHFISAFKKHYNVLPGSLNRTNVSANV